MPPVYGTSETLQDLLYTAILLQTYDTKLSTDFFPPKHINTKKDENVMQSSKEKQFL